MGIGLLKSIAKSLGVWTLSYVLLRLSILPWRFLEKASLIELSASMTLLALYAFSWRKIRTHLQPFEYPPLQGVPWILLFFGWMILYLVFWRASPQDFFIPSSVQVKDYIMSNSLGGFFLSEVTEEIAYRGILLLLLLKSGLKPAQAIVLQATVFVVPHYFGLALGHMDPMRTLSTFFLGMIFGGTSIAFRGLAVPITLHVFWNFVSGFVFLYFETSAK